MYLWTKEAILQISGMRSKSTVSIYLSWNQLTVIFASYAFPITLANKAFKVAMIPSPGNLRPGLEPLNIQVLMDMMGQVSMNLPVPPKLKESHI